MAKANGEYVKVYLMLLRYLNADDCEISISKIADILECTEKDVLRAFNYWHEAGLLRHCPETEGRGSQGLPHFRAAF